MNLYDLLTIDRSSLYGVRRGLGSIADLLPQFQSPRPMRGATRSYNKPKTGWCISIHAPHAGRDSKHAQKVPYTFAITDKRNAFSRQTPSVRVFDEKLRIGFLYKTGCEPSWKSLWASSSHYTIKVSSGRYVCLQPKCSILLSYFFPR